MMMLTVSENICILVHASHVGLLCCAKSFSTELSYQQLSGMDRIVCVDTEFLRC